MEAAVFPALLCAGIPVLAYVIGAHAMSRLRCDIDAFPLVRAALAAVVGVAVLTPVLIVAAALGEFRPSWLGAASWLLVAGAFLRWPRAPRRWHPAPAEIAVLAATALFVVVAILGRDETLGNGRDQQVYAEFAIALAQHGAPAVRYPTSDPADRALLAADRTREACHAGFLDRWRRQRLTATPFVVPGGTNACDGVDDPIVLLHPWGWPVWLAAVWRMSGIDGIFSTNAIVFAVGAVLFLGVARLVIAPLAAVAATLVLLSLPSSLWIAGITLSEPLAMTLLLAIPLLCAIGKRAGDVLAAVVTLAAILVRIDAALVVPIVMLAILPAPVAYPTALVRARSVARYQCGALAIATGFYVALFPSYLDALWTPYLAIIAASLALLVASFAMTPRAAERIRAMIAADFARKAAIAAVLALFAYAAFIRPWFAAPAASASGVHDFREYSLLNLAAYLSWPIVVAAVAGICCALWTGWQCRAQLRYPLVLLLALGSAVPLLAVPGVSADQPWGFRRFIPLVVPYAVLFAALALQALHAHARRPVSRSAFAIAAIVSIASVALLPRAAARLAENDGYTAQVAAIATALPATLTVASGAVRDVATALLVAYGKPVAAASDGPGESGDDRAAIGRWIAAKLAAGRHPWLLHDATLRDAGLVLSHQTSWTMRREFAVPQLRAPASTVAAETNVVTLSRVDGVDATFTERMFGAERAWGSREEGFYPPETADFGTFRYTTGNAWIDVATASLRGCDALKVDLLIYARTPTRRDVTITADGKVLWRGAVATGISTLRVPLPAITARPTIRIGIVSDLVDRDDMGVNDPRPRLGAGLIGIRPLRPGEPHEAGPGMDAFAARLAIIGPVRDPIVMSAAGTAQLTLAIRNLGSAYWPAYREHEAPVGVVKIALAWFRDGEPDALVGNARWPLAVSMLSGDRVRLRVPITPPARDGKLLAPGLYDVKLRMVREGVGLFTETKGDTVSIRVRIEPSPSTQTTALAPG